MVPILRFAVRIAKRVSRFGKALRNRGSNALSGSSNATVPYPLLYILSPSIPQAAVPLSLSVRNPELRSETSLHYYIFVK